MDIKVSLYFFFLIGLPIFMKAQPCALVKISDFPAKDLPSASEKISLKKAESYKYYYGVGVPVDYVKARKIAFIEAENKLRDQEPFHGFSMLLMIYANGFGVKRDLDLCIRLACANVDGGEDEDDDRVNHLKQMKTGYKGVFDLCDDILPTYAANYCVSIRVEKTAFVRKSTINKIITKWPKADQLAYKALRKAAKSFIDQRTFAEVDMSGTARAQVVDEEEDSLENNFEEKIFRADKRDFDNFSADSFSEADKELNSIYSKLMKGKDSLGHTEITKEGIKYTQQVWIAYRDAWVHFVSVRCPKVSANSIKTLFTKERISQLKELLEFEGYETE